MSIEFLCTLGPASIDNGVIPRLEAFGATLFRINLSHTALDEVAPAIALIRSQTDVPICIDTEGAQVRTGRQSGGSIDVGESSVIRAHARPIEGDAENISLYPGYIIDQLRQGDLLSVDFDAVLAQVVQVDDGSVVLRVLNGGGIGSNKAVTVERNIAMPPLTEKDEAAVAVARDLGVVHFALSFANRPSDVDHLRDLAGPDTFVISKIECRNGLRNLDAIARQSDALLIDRGDLSREVTIEQIPRIQKAIIERAKRAKRKVYVATNLLESMVSAPAPTRAEVNDIYNTLADGADGLVLAAETAIGKYPIQCAGMISRMIREHQEPRASDDPIQDEPVSLLGAPHGGTLVNRVDETIDQAELDRLPKLRVSAADLIDCEQFAYGTYSPLTGFMDRATLMSVLHDLRLPDGPTWTLPIVLGIGGEDARSLSRGQRVALTDDDGTVHALLDVSEVYAPDLDTILEPWFGTATSNHPGVRRVRDAGDHFVAGAVTLVRKLPSAFRHYALTPEQTRFIFAHKGWSRVVGFHTRNVAHRVHEHIQLEAMQRTAADGLYISPVIGPKKANDFLTGPIMKSYQLMLDDGVYPPGKVVLGSLSTYSRYCGPREAVFTALCRKNNGCSHFIIGRDHTGVGEFYAPDANARMFDKLGDIGIEPLFFDAYGYDKRTGTYVSSNEAAELESISGTQARETLRAGKSLPDWFMRDIVQAMLRDDIAAGRPVFHQ